MKKPKQKISPELILPGGDPERVKIAFLYGADACFIGLEKYSLRKGGVNFSLKEMAKTIEHAHKIGKKIYVTFNIFAHDQDLKSIEQDMKKIAALVPDAFIIADPGVFRIAKRIAPQIPIHISTQANSVNKEDILFWKEQGVKRVVLGRELTLAEIKEIHKAVPEVELEVFVHGAMCISYSGRCLISNYMTGRASNSGECAQPCRWQYDFYAEEKQRPGELFKIEESEKGTAFMSSKDLRTVNFLDEILAAGVTGLKIEGRNKTEYYVATVASTYRTALDLIAQNKYTKAHKEALSRELEKLNYRDYTTGFLLGEAQKGETYPDRSPIRKWDYLGMTIEQGKGSALEKGQHIVVKNKIQKGEELEILTPKGLFKDHVVSITSPEGEDLIEVNPGRTDQKAYLIFKKGLYPEFSMLRKPFKR